MVMYLPIFWLWLFGHEDGVGDCMGPQWRCWFGWNGVDLDEYVGVEVSRVLVEVMH